jgi:hypothetical protein
MEKEYDFAKGERGKFYRKEATFTFPVYLDPDVDDFVTRLAERRKVEVQALVNEWLRANIEIIRDAQ